MQSLFCQIYNLQNISSLLGAFDRQIRYYGSTFDHYNNL